LYLVSERPLIEHLGDVAGQQHMANEVRRVGKRYFVQTPNLFFPIEPHFHVPFYQFLPIRWRVALIRRFDLGWYKKIPDKHAATTLVTEHRLLSERDMRMLFPQARLYKEHFFGLTKSFIAYDGFDTARTVIAG
jgi:hypothetical protein